MITEPALEDFRDLADRFAADRHDRQRRNELDASGLRAARGCRLPAHRGIDQGRRHVRERAPLNPRGHRDPARACPGRLRPLPWWHRCTRRCCRYGSPPMRSLVHIRRSGPNSGSCWATWPRPTGSARLRVNRAAAATCRNRGRSRDRAQTVDGCLSGQKHFGSGSGLASFMLTIARPAGEEDPGLVLCGRPRRAVGRIARDEADRAMGRARHDRDPEPRLRVSGFPGCADRVARELACAR